MTTIYADDPPTTPIVGLAPMITDECLSILREPEKSQAKSATLVLGALIDTTRMYILVLILIPTLNFNF